MTAHLLESLALGQWNPHYLAYAIDTDAADLATAFERDGGNHRFFAWNGTRWEETCKRIGAHPHACAAYGNDHLDTIAAHLGQNSPHTRPEY